MSYDEALQVARDYDTPPPAFDPEGPAVHAARSADRRLFRWIRGWLVLSAVGYAGLAGVGWFIGLEMTGFMTVEILGIGPSLSVLLPLGLVLWSLTRLRDPSFGTQMILRGVWWSSLLVGTLVCINFNGMGYRFAGLAIAVGSGIALLLLGQRGLERNGGAFAPIAYRGELLLALVLAAADALNLLFWGVGLVNLQFWVAGAYISGAYLSVACGLIMVLAVWGLSRMRTWALLLNMVANLVIAGLGMNGILELPGPVVLALFTTAAIQLLLPVPILAAALGDKPTGKPRLFGWGPAVVRASIIALVGFALLGTADTTSSRYGWAEDVFRVKNRGVAARVGWAAPRYNGKRRAAPTAAEIRASEVRMKEYRKAHGN